MFAAKDMCAMQAATADGQAPARLSVPALCSEGRLRLAFKRRYARTVLGTLYQSGSLRARLTRAEPGHCTEAVLVNTAGGLTGGDRQEIVVDWQAGTRATMTTLACEKIYRAAADSASVTTDLTVGEGAVAEWLPQETIVFDRAALRRDLQVHLAVGAVFTGIEAVVLGRTAMGETVRQAAIRDGWRIWRGNRLIYADATALDGDVEPLLASAAASGGRTAWATLLHVGAGAEAILDRIRGLLPNNDAVLAAASAWDGLMAARILARNGAALRHAAVTVLDAIRQGYALPRVWQI